MSTAAASVGTKNTQTGNGGSGSTFRPPTFVQSSGMLQSRSTSRPWADRSDFAKADAKAHADASIRWKGR